MEQKIKHSIGWKYIWVQLASVIISIYDKMYFMEKSITRNKDGH